MARVLTLVPPYFNGTNYAYWKARIGVFLKSKDFKIWGIVVNRWSSPKKEQKEWTIEEKNAYSANYKALNAIICAISQE